MGAVPIHWQSFGSWHENQNACINCGIQIDKAPEEREQKHEISDDKVIQLDPKTK